MSHLGRPKAKEPEFSLKNIISEVEDVLGVSVSFSDDCIGSKAIQMANDLEPGQVLLLENLRYYNEEKQGDVAFANALSKLGDIYVNDAFGTAHRAHASTSVIAQFFPDNKCFGYLLEQEIISIDKVLTSGEKPVLAILGGAKVSSKITIIENILDNVDHLIIGGGMSFTFVKAQGGSIGDSICEDDKMDLALDILRLAKEKNVQLHLPVDVLAADDFSNTANTQIVDIKSIAKNWQGLDCGPKSKAIFHDVVQQCKTILWNGPLGVFELDTFSTGTKALGDSIAEATQNGAFSLVGGGDSVAAVKKFGFQNKVSYVSTGGGAMLESLEGKILPGIAAINA
jgi:phosphoglycerate kinase